VEDKRLPTPGIAESAFAVTEQGPTSLPDTAMTAHLPRTVCAPDAAHRLVAGACPRCGSTAFKQLKAKRGTTLTNDRECKDCGTHYMTIPAPVSSAVRTAMQFSGVMVILGGILAALLQLALTSGSAGVGGGSFRLYGVIFSVMAGMSLLRMPQQTQELREKRLKEYLASASPDSPPPVELPRSPDVVFLSGLFGTLALVVPLVSSLFLALAFGPLAIVFGAVALAQGHRKGLIGTILGVVGLVGWGLLFVFVFLG